MLLRSKLTAFFMRLPASSCKRAVIESDQCMCSSSSTSAFVTFVWSLWFVTKRWKTSRLVVTQNESLTPGPGSCVILLNLLFEFSGQIASTDECAVHAVSTRTCVVLRCTCISVLLSLGLVQTLSGRLCCGIHRLNSCEEEELNWARHGCVKKLLVTSRRYNVRSLHLKKNRNSKNGKCYGNKHASAALIEFE